MSQAETITPARCGPASVLGARVAADRWGSMSPSVYETARLVRTAAWLDGHRGRCDFLLRTQNPDGSWGSPDGYDLVPTLSATEALLHVFNGQDRAGVDSAELLARAVRRGLRALFARLGPDNRTSVPDTIAVEIIVPWLVHEINDQLGETRLFPPPGVDQRPLTRLRSAARAGHPIPEKTWHTLEALGTHAAGAEGVRPRGGAVGASPAATVAWLGASDMPALSGAGATSVVALLRDAQARHGGPVSGVISISTFERAWVLGWLLDAGVPWDVPPELLADLERRVGGSGAAAGPGLPEDADDTAAVIHALALAGRRAPVDPLWSYEADSYFHCFPGEATPSTSTNAHVLEALLAGETGQEPARRWAAVHKIESWLLGQQRENGSWLDKWHASPYYATMCVALALSRRRSPGTAAAIPRAQRWVLDCQRDDGSWGCWQGTVEETAYAVLTLLRPPPTALAEATSSAVARAYAYLLREHDDLPPLWHDKDLYAPVAVIKTARLAALHTAETWLEGSPTASSRNREGRP